MEPICASSRRTFMRPVSAMLFTTMTSINAGHCCPPPPQPLRNHAKPCMCECVCASELFMLTLDNQCIYKLIKSKTKMIPFQPRFDPCRVWPCVLTKPSPKPCTRVLQLDVLHTYANTCETFLDVQALAEISLPHAPPTTIHATTNKLELFRYEYTL